jgi:hypothetical protein
VTNSTMARLMRSDSLIRYRSQMVVMSSFLHLIRLSGSYPVIVTNRTGFVDSKSLKYSKKIALGEVYLTFFPPIGSL